MRSISFTLSVVATILLGLATSLGAERQERMPDGVVLIFPDTVIEEAINNAANCVEDALMSGDTVEQRQKFTELVALLLQWLWRLVASSMLTGALQNVRRHALVLMAVVRRPAPRRRSFAILQFRSFTSLLYTSDDAEDTP